MAIEEIYSSSWQNVKSKEHYTTALKRSKCVEVKLPYGRPIPRDKLEAEYIFSNNAQDTSGKGRHGTVIGNAKYTTGQIGNAFDFDGNTIIQIPNIPLTQCTITGAFFMSDKISPANYIVMLNGKYMISPFQVFRWKDGYSIYDEEYEHSTGGQLELIQLGNISRDNKWHFVALVCIGQGNFYAYRDNVKYTALGNSAQLGYTDKNCSYIGTAGEYRGSYNFKSTVPYDNIRIYSRALTDHEIEKLYNETWHRVLI